MHEHTKYRVFFLCLVVVAIVSAVAFVSIVIPVLADLIAAAYDQIVTDFGNPR